jgi:hypothetical protein
MKVVVAEKEPPYKDMAFCSGPETGRSIRSGRDMPGQLDEGRFITVAYNMHIILQYRRHFTFYSVQIHCSA